VPTCLPNSCTSEIAVYQKKYAVNQTIAWAPANTSDCELPTYQELDFTSVIGDIEAAKFKGKLYLVMFKVDSDDWGVGRTYSTALRGGKAWEKGPAFSFEHPNGKTSNELGWQLTNINDEMLLVSGGRFSAGGSAEPFYGNSVYQLASGAWSKMSWTLKQGLYGHCTLGIGSFLVVLGGLVPTPGNPMVELQLKNATAYDTKNNGASTDLPEMMESFVKPEYGMGNGMGISSCVYANGKIYVQGYQNADLSLDTPAQATYHALNVTVDDNGIRADGTWVKVAKERKNSELNTHFMVVNSKLVLLDEMGWISIWNDVENYWEIKSDAPKPGNYLDFLV